MFWNLYTVFVLYLFYHYAVARYFSCVGTLTTIDRWINFNLPHSLVCVYDIVFWACASISWIIACAAQPNWIKKRQIKVTLSFLTMPRQRASTIGDADRIVHFGHSERTLAARADAKFCHNGIKTTKYTVLTFIPKTLMEQFRRFGMYMWFCCS